MDPISAVGFAASIITFIDFGFKIVTGTLEVLKTGSLSDNTHISVVINDFRAVVKPLAQLPAGKSEHEAALKELGIKCQSVSHDLFDLLEMLKTSPAGSTWKSVRVALRFMRNRGEVLDLEEKLDKYRCEIMTRLAFLLNERQLAIQVQLAGFQSQVVKQSSDEMEQLEIVRNDVLEAVESTLSQLPPPAYQDSGAGGSLSSATDQLQRLHGIRETLDETSVEHPEEGWDDYASQRKAAAASRFQHWLREGTGVFHISGKPGSGKSTLMKLLLSDERTRHQGRRVHRRAFLQLQQHQEGFTDLRARPPPPGYRFCLFIDGLDEYGGDNVDELEHQRLADALSSWAAHPDVKILASSRPHRQFEDTFSDDQRIRLHELTRSDIVLADRQMFERDKSFKRPEVQACYADLVKRVAYASDGVFLWATLAIRDLLNAIGRYDPIDSLQQRLQGMPRNFNKLYESIFMSIDPVDQARAFKILFLVAEQPAGVGALNALSLTRLRDLEDADFPMKCGFKPYTVEEMRRRHLEAQHQVDSLTKGLVEIVDVDAVPFIYAKRVQLFHRTARDFVCQSSILQEFAARVPDLTDVSAYARLLLAELQCGRGDDIRLTPEYEAIVMFHGSRFSHRLLDAYGAAMEHHHNESSENPTPLFLGATITIHEACGEHDHKMGPIRFLHYLAFYGCVYYVQRKIAADLDLLRP
ncbi:hypothetical protein N658DRAFT_561739 [Parathielavia hyrcaniae]|uniref:DUF7791 domain-containing protein n=1 Tax=Parathielavia hyrcaniae TaxID=113614 RepID=A0AAN6PWQ1_9PEZI|nr:hypothetical protein N658DRAFT_561739 [Parathielavia hyrcaniae]